MTSGCTAPLAIVRCRGLRGRMVCLNFLKAAAQMHVRLPSPADEVTWRPVQAVQAAPSRAGKRLATVMWYTAWRRSIITRSLFSSRIWTSTRPSAACSALA